MALPYDSALLKAHVPGGTQAYINRSLGTITASDLDPASSAKVSMILAQKANSVFGTAWNPCVCDSTSPGPPKTIDRSSGSSYPDGLSITPPTGSHGVSEMNSPGHEDDDAHWVYLDYANDRIVCLRKAYGASGSTFPCYSGGVSPYNGVEQLWNKTPFTGSAPGGNGSPGTGSGINIAHGTLFPEDIQVFASTGQVRHGLRFTLRPANVSSGVVFPAYKTDGVGAGTTLKEGQMIYMAFSDADIYGTSLSTGIRVNGNTQATIAARCIAEMLRTKGGRLEDRSGGGFKFNYVRGNSWTMLGQTDPWPSVLGGYSNPSTLMQAVVGWDWSKMRVLKDTFVAPDVTTPPEEPPDDPEEPPPPPPPPSAPTAAPQIPQALIASADEDATTVVATLQADTTRTRTRIQRRLVARTDTSPTSGSVTNIYDNTDSQAWGNTNLTGTMQTRRPGVDELLLIRIDLPEEIPSGLKPWVYVSGLGGGSGTAKICPVFYHINQATGLPNFSGGHIGGTEVTIAAGTPAAPVSFSGDYSAAFAIFGGGPIAYGLQIGGASNVLQIPRSDDGVGEWYVDTGFTYNSAPAGPANPSSASVGTKRSALWFTAGTPGGGAGGGTITDGETGLSSGSYHYTVYAENAAGSSLRDATPSPVVVTGAEVPTPNVAPIPVIAYTIDAYVTGQNGRTVRFSDQSVDTDGTIVVRAWDYLGNGSFTTVDSTSPTYFYPPGTYRPKLRITDDDGAVTTSAGDTTITITAEATPGGGVPIVIRDGGRNAAPAQARPVPGVNTGEGSGG